MVEETYDRVGFDARRDHGYRRKDRLAVVRSENAGFHSLLDVARR